MSMFAHNQLHRVARRMKLGKWTLLTVEDYLMVFALVSLRKIWVSPRPTDRAIPWQINFTGVVVCINEVAKNGSNYMEPEDAAKLDDKGIAQAIWGSKMTFVLEIFTLTATWTVKACLLILYGRLTIGTSLKQRWGVRFVAGYCLLTYVLVTLMFVFYWCNPTYEYWRVPVKISEYSDMETHDDANT